MGGCEHILTHVLDTLCEFLQDIVGNVPIVTNSVANRKIQATMTTYF